MPASVTSWRGHLTRLARMVLYQIKAMAEADQAVAAQQTAAMNTQPKLHGRAFYRALGEPKYVVAPMVDRSEFAWRMLTRSYLDEATSKQMLAYTPMLHARLFQEKARFRNDHFQPTKSSLDTTDPPPPDTKPFLDGNPSVDRPLFVQFCANKPNEFLAAAKYVAPYCDAVDLNLGCPQGIAKSGQYGAFLQEHWDTIHKMISTLHKELSVPVTAKMRILETKEKTLEYAKMILSAGASIITVHGRRREQKGHNTGLADWQYIRYLRDNLPPETVIFANGNILNWGDLDECLKVTGADGVMSAEGNLSDPTIFAKPPTDEASREYWRSSTDKSVGGYRLDGVIRRYLDIIYKYVLERPPPVRRPLWIPGDSEPEVEEEASEDADSEQPPKKKRKKDNTAQSSPSIRVMQGHLFGLLKPILATRHDIRDTLARTRTGDFAGFEKVLSMVEEATKEALKEDARQVEATEPVDEKKNNVQEEMTFSQRTVAKYRRPWWVAQPYIRPLPEEALAKGALAVSKKEKAKEQQGKSVDGSDPAIRRTDDAATVQDTVASNETPNELPKPALHVSLDPAIICLPRKTSAVDHEPKKIVMASKVGESLRKIAHHRAINYIHLAGHYHFDFPD